MIDPSYLSKVKTYLLQTMAVETKIAIAKISNNPNEFIKAVKCLIDNGEISQHQFNFDGDYKEIKKGTTFEGFKKYKLVDDKIVFIKDIDESDK
jgi:hypothetical protein